VPDVVSDPGALEVMRRTLIQMAGESANETMLVASASCVAGFLLAARAGDLDLPLCGYTRAGSGPDTGPADSDAVAAICAAAPTTAPDDLAAILWKRLLRYLVKHPFDG
jgi:hypothetical protein